MDGSDIRTCSTAGIGNNGVESLGSADGGWLNFFIEDGNSKI